MNVSPEKKAALLERMQRLGVRESDLQENFILGSGSGGQKINKTASCVQLRHSPSGIEVRCQASRSQAMNRFLARRLLCERLEEKISGEKSARQQAIEKIRRQKRRRTRKQKQKMLEQKKHQAEKKHWRKPVSTRE